MTLLVQIASWVSGAIAIVVLALAMWPKSVAPVLPSAEQSAIPGARLEIVTPSEPVIEILDPRVEKPIRKIEMPTKPEPIGY